MTEPNTSDARSPFWRFSLRFYRRPGVADACLALQDEAGVDVNLLLFLLWQAVEGRQIPAADVTRLEERIAPWRTTVVVPLRTLRRALKAAPDPVGPEAGEAFRTRIKAVELEAERLQQEAMFAMSQAETFGAPAASTEAAARANIEACQATLPGKFSTAAVAVLLTALTSEISPPSQGRV